MYASCTEKVCCVRCVGCRMLDTSPGVSLTCKNRSGTRLTGLDNIPRNREISYTSEIGGVG